MSATLKVERLVAAHEKAEAAEHEARLALLEALRRYERRRGVRELARLASVSPTAVSMFFSGNPNAVARDKAIRLLTLDVAASPTDGGQR